ncbi:MAG: phosphate ABC transporter substrate-binding protein [Chitinivorax sp.]
MKTQTILLAACAALQLGFSALASAEPLAIIVSSKNANASLSNDQAEKVFLGKLDAFPDGSTAVPLDLPKGPVREEFYLKVTGKNPSQVKAYWAKQVFTGSGQPPKEVESSTDLVDLIAKNPNLVGYVEKSKVNSSVKVLYSLP